MTTPETTTDAAALIAEARELAGTFLPGKWPDTMNALASALEAAIEREGRLREALRECADDLEAEIKARALGELPRRIARDLDTVERARAALGGAT
jgi:hypothetical protein